MTKDNNKKLKELLADYVAAVETDIGRWLIESGTPGELAEAMRYCMVGGKRLRPCLVQLSAEATGAQINQLVRRSAVAVEMVHVYSLVHDDLPAMDDDDLRRGRPTAHVKFGQAMAILIGDALLTRAMGLLTEAEIESQATKSTIRLVAELAAGAGATGMVAGQVADMDLCKIPAGREGLDFIHTRKTGAMLRASARMGAIAAGADDKNLAIVTEYAEKLGLAFQIFDDLLDATGTAEQLGKTPGKDAQAGKRTYVTELGPARAEQLGRELTDSAIAALQPLGQNAEKLKYLAKLLTERKH